MPNSRQRNVSYDRTMCLWQPNDRRSVIRNTILDALTHGPGPIPTVTAFRLPTESSEPCSLSMKKLEFVEFPAFIPNSGPLIGTGLVCGMSNWIWTG